MENFCMKQISLAKKSLYSVLLLAFILCLPIFRINLASGLGYTMPGEGMDSDTGQSEETVDIVPEPPAVPAVTDGIYRLSLTSSIGTLTYYNQSDARWADYLYGGTDPMAAFGCGPTAMAMIVTSFTNETFLPSDMAAWAAEHGYWAPDNGTKHSFIPECAAAFGLKASSFQNLTEDGVKAELSSGHILVALMGIGHFSDSGHFIIITDYWSKDQVRVADPASLERTQQAWDIALILSELNSVAASGGPVWSISPK